MSKKQIAIVVGHEPCGGAEGEREYNIIVAKHLKKMLEDAGFDIYQHMHTVKPYGLRQTIMANAVKSAQPQNIICVELHYNDVDIPQPHGHQFHYNAAKVLAQTFAKHWKKSFPGSKPRQDAGTYHTPTGDGAGFLRKSPGMACLVEPFFRSNPGEWTFFRNKHKEVAAAYAAAIVEYANRI